MDGGNFLPYIGPLTDALAVLKIPVTDAIVCAHTNKLTPMRQPADSQRMVRVPFEVMDNFTGGDIGDFNKLVGTRACDVFTIL